MSAFLTIKVHLPLLSYDEYSKRHGSERGFTSKEVESSLRRLILSKKVRGGVSSVSWDEVIDLFIITSGGSFANTVS